MRRRAGLHLDVGQRELEEEMGVLAGLSTADGLFDVELKGKDRQTDRHRWSEQFNHRPKAISEVRSIPPPHGQCLFTSLLSFLHYLQRLVHETKRNLHRMGQLLLFADSGPTRLRSPAFLGRVFGPPVHVYLPPPIITRAASPPVR